MQGSWDLTGAGEEVNCGELCFAPCCPLFGHECAAWKFSPLFLRGKCGKTCGGQKAEEVGGLLWSSSASRGPASAWAVESVEREAETRFRTFLDLACVNLSSSASVSLT